MFSSKNFLTSIESLYNRHFYIMYTIFLKCLTKETAILCIKACIECRMYAHIFTFNVLVL